MTVSNRKIKSKYKGHVTVRAKHGEEFGGAIADGSITASKIAPGAVINTTVADNSIDSNHYIDGSIDGVHIANNSIGTNHLGVDVIVAEDIANNAITVAELADNAVTAAKISSNDPQFCVDAGGNVGIGNTNPSHDLTIGSATDPGTTEQRLKIYRGIDDPGQNLEMGYRSIILTRADLLTLPQSTFSIWQKGSDSERNVFHIDPAGNVGIGTENPDEKLEVRGNLRFGPTAYGSVREVSMGNLPLNGFYDLMLHNAFQGFLIVSITSRANAAIRTYATYSVFGRGTDFNFALITSQDGTSGGVTFTLSSTTTIGGIRLQNNTNVDCQSTMVFYGSTSF